MQALQSRGYQANLGIRAWEFDGVAFQLTGYQTVIVLGGDGRVPIGGDSGAAEVPASLGGLILDAPMINGGLANDRSGVLGPFLPAVSCSYLSHNKTGFLRVDPAEPGFDENVAGSFDVSLSAYFQGYSETEACLSPVMGARTLYYSQGSEETRPRSGAVVYQAGPKTRVVAFSVGIRYLVLQSADFQRLFTNAVGWAAARTPTPLVVPPNSIYVFRTGDSAADWGDPPGASGTGVTGEPWEFERPTSMAQAPVYRITRRSCF